MPMTTDVDTTGFEPAPVEATRFAPPLEIRPARSPFFISSIPSTSVANPDAIRNFQSTLPSYRINPAPPLAAAGAGTNATATASTPRSLLQPVPAPTIASPLATVPTGYTFSFNEVRLPLSDAFSISSYKIYRNTSNSFASASPVQGIVHHQDSLANPVVIQDSQPNGVTRFYWVTAVSDQGRESSPTPAQSGTVVSKAGFNSNNQLASSFNGVPLNTNFASLAGSPSLSNTGGTTPIVIAATGNAFAPGSLFYNSGSVDSTLFGNHVILASDPTFSGGAVIYTFGFFLQQQVNSDSNVLIGQILTAPGGASTGGGQTGGTTGPRGIGGRGLALP